LFIKVDQLTLQVGVAEEMTAQGERKIRSKAIMGKCCEPNWYRTLLPNWYRSDWGSFSTLSSTFTSEMVVVDFRITTAGAALAAIVCGGGAVVISLLRTEVISYAFTKLIS